MSSSLPIILATAAKAHALSCVQNFLNSGTAWPILGGKLGGLTRLLKGEGEADGGW